MASLSAILQIASGAYAQFVSVPFNSPTMLLIYFIGFSLAFVGFVCGLGGLFEKSPLRFKAPSLSAILLLLWFWHAMAE